MYDATAIRYNEATETYMIEGTNPAAIPSHDLEQMQQANWYVSFGARVGDAYLYTYNETSARLAAKRLGVQVVAA